MIADNLRKHNDSRRREPTAAELEAIERNALEQSYVRPLPYIDQVLRGDFYDPDPV